MNNKVTRKIVLNLIIKKMKFHTEVLYFEKRLSGSSVNLNINFY